MVPVQGLPLDVGDAMTRVVLRIDFDEERYIGHGRIRLLELIGEHGSIAQAAKAMDMSYKRAWYLVDAFSKCFDTPLIERQHGGKGGGSAQLTEFGRDVIDRYRRMESVAAKAIRGDISKIEVHLASNGHRSVRSKSKKRSAGSAAT